MTTFLTVILFFFFQTAPVTISGTVETCKGAAIIGATISFSNSGGTVLTDKAGRFSISLPYGWSGTAVPSLKGITFKPDTLTFPKVITNQTCSFEGGVDTDGDTIFDECDNCPAIPNKDQADLDLDGIGDVCDNCPTFKSTNQTDTDQDGRGDVCDNCPDSSNTNQSDADMDDVGDVCDYQPQPILLLPNHRSTEIPINPTLEWNIVPEAVTYRVQLSTDSLFSALIVDDSTLTAPEKSVDSLLSSTSYFWRVNEKNKGGTSIWSVTWKFTTTASGSTGVASSGSQLNRFAILQNYPNPFNPSTVISFNIPTRSFVSLKIFDVSGKEVAVIVSQELAAGQYTRQWNAALIPSGTYFCRLQAGSFIDTKKIMLIK